MSLNIRNMKEENISIIYEIALRAFNYYFEKYHVYPHLIDAEEKKFLPPIIFGKEILLSDKIIGGVFVIHTGKRGEIGAIFLDPLYQNKGYGKETMLMLEKTYPFIKRWKLETPSKSHNLHKFYESLGYKRKSEMKDRKRGIVWYIYEKSL